MDPLLQQVLIGYGVNLSSDAIKAIVRKAREYIQRNPNASQSELVEEIIPLLHIHNANMVAQGVINFLIENGELIVEGSKIDSGKSIKYGAQKFTVGDETVSSTPKSVIDLGKGAYIKGIEAEIEQDKDGNIIFKTKS